jgi:hypothetical protein
MSLASLAALSSEVGAGAVLFCSAEHWEDGPPPRVALSVRVVRAPDGMILGADELARAGEDHPGLFGLHEVGDPLVLMDQVLDVLAPSIVQALARQGDATAWHHPRPKGTHRPRKVYRDPGLDRPRDAPLRVAVLPFENLSERPEADLVFPSLFTTHLAGRAGIHVLEPGEVREVLLDNRVIQEFGLSLAGRRPPRPSRRRPRGDRPGPRLRGPGGGVDPARRVLGARHRHRRAQGRLVGPEQQPG